MHVRLVSHSQPTLEYRDLGITDAQELVAYCARVSNPANQFNTETSEKLIRYLVKHQHWSPLEMVSACLEITTTRDIARQILRQRSFSFQEFSQRYAPSDTAEPVELRTQDRANRQGSGEAFSQEWAIEAVAKSVDMAFRTYRTLLQEGVSRETARMVLPLCTQTTLYMTGNIRSWIHYFDQRCAKGTQKEHRDIATAIRDEIFAKEFSAIHQAIEEAK